MFLIKNSLAIAKKAAAAAEEKKAKDTVILKLSKLTLIADYFVITSGDSEPQLKAISNFIMRKFKENKIRLLLEYIWQEAKKIRLLKRKKILKEEK